MAVRTALITNYGRRKMIRINEDWIIDVDDHNYILKRDMHTDRIRKDGKVEHVYNIKGYFSSPDKALKSFGEEIVRDRLKESEMGLPEAVQAIRESIEGWNRTVKSIMRTEGKDNDT